HQSGSSPDLWAPLRTVKTPRDLANHRMAFYSGVMGRLRDGQTAGQAEAELTALYQQVRAAEPGDPKAPRDPPANFRLQVQPGAHGLDALSRGFTQPLALLLGVAAVVLLIAGVNVANLMLARGMARGG